MNCPVCRSELKVIGQGHLEGLDWHICKPNDQPPLSDKYGCSNTQCSTINKVFWNDNGELFCEDGTYLDLKNISFIDNNNAPFGTITRQINVEIHKDDENFDLLTLGKYTFRVKYNYQSNEDGDILRKKRKIEVWKKSNDGLTSTYVYLPWTMILYNIKTYHKNRKLYKKHKDTWYLREIKKYNEPISEYYKKNWCRKIPYFYCKLFNKLFPVI